LNVKYLSLFRAHFTADANNLELFLAAARHFAI
jgi:hypothetical protein